MDNLKSVRKTLDSCVLFIMVKSDYKLWLFKLY